MIDLSPVRQQLLSDALDVQERMLQGVTLIFRGLSDHNDPEVSSVSRVALKLLTETQEILEAMIDGLNATRH
jgi:hypothetical protein